MSHTASESFAIVPHNVESSRADTLVPDQLRGQAANLINMMTEYYDYMNEDGVVTSIDIINPGAGSVLAYNDLLKSEAGVGIECFSFVPSNYNQQFIKLSDAETKSLKFGASIAYRGLNNPNYFVLKMDKNRDNLYNTWVMAYDNNGTLQCDFYDSLHEAGIGSNTDDVSNISFRGNSGGSFSILDTGVAAAFVAGNNVRARSTARSTAARSIRYTKP